MNKIIPVWKEKGISSYDVIRKIKHNISNVKIGHSGTLDPFAEGMMIICTGNKTKHISQYMSYDKVYESKIFIGKETDTLDLTGNVIKTGNCEKIKITKLKNVLKKFNGEIYQSPPYFSAVKLNGVRLYNFARNDIYIRKKPRLVKINDIKILKVSKNIINLRISVGKGFYIRSFAKDLAKELGSFGYILELKRVSIGPFKKSDTVEIEKIK